MKNSILDSKYIVVLFLFSIFACKKEKNQTETCHQNIETTAVNAIENGYFKAKKTESPIQIDGCMKDAIWAKTDWYTINYLWMGKPVDSTDYYGRFKLAWDTEHLYIFTEITDDVLTPTLASGLENYWKGDYVEVFIDEDQSGGNHQYNHQAFAYHVSTEGHAIDKNTLQETTFFDNHVTVTRTQNGNKHYWEMAISLFDNQFDENSNNNTPIKIQLNKQIGFSIAYGDNDGTNSRENFMGSKRTHGKNNDEGYINSNVFGRILFVE